MSDTLQASARPDFVVVPTWLLERTDLSHGAFRLWVILRSFLNAGQTVAWPKRAVLAERMGLAKADSVDRFVRELQTAGLLAVEASYTEVAEGEGARRTSNRYTLQTDEPLKRGSRYPDMGEGVPPKHGQQEVEPLKYNQKESPEPPSGVPPLPGLEAKSSQEAPERPDVERLCRLMQELVRQNVARPDRVQITKRWRDDARRLLDVDKLSLQRVEQVMRWACADTFWRSNVQGIPKLRDKFDTLAAQMDRRPPGAAEPARRGSMYELSEEERAESRRIADEYAAREAAAHQRDLEWAMAQMDQ